MKTRSYLLIPFLAVLPAVLFAVAALADPLPGEALKFQQLPQNGPEFFGHDELSTAYGTLGPNGTFTGQGNFVADDFADKFNSPVVHLRWWGSYLDNQGITQGVTHFLISFESDIPAGPNVPFSRPGEPMLNQIVRKGPLAPGSGTFTEVPVPGGGPEQLFRYHAELHLGKEFRQQPNSVYWLKIVALLDTSNDTVRWGWHNRDYSLTDPLASTAPAVNPGEHVEGPTGFPIWHFQDDAVSGRLNVVDNPNDAVSPFVTQDPGSFAPQRYVAGRDGPALIADFSKDLAFELYTVPEPATGVVFAAGLLLLRRRHGA